MKLYCRRCLSNKQNPNILEIDRDEVGYWYVGCYVCGFGYDRSFKELEDAEKSFMGKDE